jgi:DNA polymerase-3 subunit delta
MPVLVVAGDEEFEVFRKVAELRKSLLDPAWAAMNFVRFENPPLHQIIDLAAALPFGPGNKVILIDKCELFTKKKSKGGGADSDDAPASAKGKSTELDHFEAALFAVAPNTYLIFACESNFDSTLKTAKAASKHAKVEEYRKERYFPGSRSPKYETWCSKEAKRHSATIDDDAIHYLLEGTDANLRQISSEIAKAAVKILPATHIKLETVVELSPHQSHVFALAESWVSGRGRDALDSVQELLARTNAIPIIAAMQTLLAKWVMMKALCERYNAELPSQPGSTRRELPLPELVKRVAQEMKLHPFAAEKDMKRIARIPLKNLIAKRVELTRLEDLLKTGQIPEQHALELFLVAD